MIGYSVITIIFTENREKYLGYGESAAGLGCMLGPVFGSVLNSAFSYFTAFLVFSVILAIAGLAAYFLLPETLNSKLSEEDESL